MKSMLKSYYAIAAGALIFGLAPPAQADEQTSTPQTKPSMAEQSMMPPTAADKKKTKGPMRHALKAIGKELGTSMNYMGKDMVMFLSVQDIDPYETGPPTDKPYTSCQIRLIDGSSASMTKYPDDSYKISGGVFDGTVIVPKQGNVYIIRYPNGTQGRVEKLGDGLTKVYRPDKTVTTIKRNMSGRLSISNDKLGYLGTATPNTGGATGSQWDIRSGSF